MFFQILFIAHLPPALQNSANFMQRRWFYSKLTFSLEILKGLSKVFHKSNCLPQIYAIKSHQANTCSSLNIKIGNMLQKFSCISFLFKPPCDNGL